MKAIIIAAGRGKRMGRLTDDRPKCLLEFGGRRLLDFQLEALRANGIEDISLVVGYKKEAIRYPGLKYYHNDRYEHNNILNSLFYAEQEMDGEFIASYCDILFGPDLVERLCAAEGDICAVVDTDWRRYYRGRHGHPVEEAEKVVFDPSRRLVKVGKKLSDDGMISGEFIGMIKCSKSGAETFRRQFDQARRRYRGKPFHEAAVFEKAYVTDILQDLACAGVTVRCVDIRGGWWEIDTVQDYRRAQRRLAAQEKIRIQ